MALLTPAEHERVAAAICAAETKTAGEIFAVVTEASDSYRSVLLLWAALATLLGGIVAAFAWPVAASLWQGTSADWTAQSDSADWPALTAQSLALGQAVVFASLASLSLVSGMALRFVPQAEKERRAHRFAMAQFLAHNLHATQTRTGVLVFVSVAEHYAAVIADKGIDERVEPGLWKKIVDDLAAEAAAGRLADGFITAISACGTVLAQHFPPRPSDENELPDRLVEI